MSNNKRGVERVDITFDDGSKESYRIVQGVRRTEPAQIMDGTRIVKSFRTVVVGGEINESIDDAIAASETPQSISDAPEEQPHD